MEQHTTFVRVIVNCIQTRSRGDLKRAVLKSLADGRWHYPQEVARSVSLDPPRAIHAYLARLHRQGLLERGQDASGRLGYRLSGPAARDLLAAHWRECHAAQGVQIASGKLAPAEHIPNQKTVQPQP